MTLDQQTINSIATAVVAVVAAYFHWSNATKIAVQKVALDAAAQVGDTHAQLVAALPGMLRDAAAAGAAMPGAVPPGSFLNPLPTAFSGNKIPPATS